MSIKSRMSTFYGLAFAVAVGTMYPSASRAKPLTDPYGTWTLQAENDAVSTFKGTSDQYYTSGLRLNWTSGTDNLPSSIARINRALLGDGVQRISLGLQQLIYTPTGRQLLPENRDRPYAGVMLGTVNLINDTDLSRSVAGIQFGMMGPAALGRQVQNGFHNLIGDPPRSGWSHQLANQPILQIQAGRIWRLPLAEVYGLNLDILPAVSGAAGDYRTYADVATTVRFGQGLDSDFGSGTIGPGLDGTDAYRMTRQFVWYAFGGVEGQAVGYDATLQGGTFRSNAPHVEKMWDTGALHAGLAVMWHGVRVSYSQNWQTAQFRTQRSGLFNYGSFNLSVKF